MEDLSTYRARVGCFVDRGRRPKSKMDPYRLCCRLSATGEFLVCLSLLLVWGMIIQACTSGCTLQDSTEGPNSCYQRSSSVSGVKKAWGWEGLSVMTSRGLSVSTTVSWGWRGAVKLVIRRHSSLDELASTSPVEVFPFSTIPCDGDVHPHPGPFTPTTPTTTTPTTPTPPLIHNPTRPFSAGLQQPDQTYVGSQESTNLPIL